MFLKKLTLKGFKSFEKTTELEFLPGISAIVGPNGSGKSNIVDALLWVMGEQGTHVLRSTSMQDVIFSGSASKSALGRAEVEIIIDNTAGLLPIAFSEVSIKRTLFRSGSSEYRLNDQEVRLVDVQELLSDTNLGKSMHTVVGQGRLDNILNSTAETRRQYIEEAAGILKYRQRKEKSMRKLDQMQPNLFRLEDLLAELQRQMTPLSRQAKIARKAQFIEDEIFDAQARLLADDYFRHQELLEKHRTKSSKISEALIQMNRQQIDLNEKIIMTKDELAKTNPKLQELSAVYHELRALKERYVGFLNLTHERVRHFQLVAKTPEDLDEKYREHFKVINANLYLTSDSELAGQLISEHPELMVIDTTKSKIVSNLVQTLRNQLGLNSSDQTLTGLNLDEHLSTLVQTAEQLTESLRLLDESLEQSQNSRSEIYQLVTEQNEYIQKFDQDLRKVANQIEKKKDELRDFQVAQSAIEANFEQVKNQVEAMHITEGDLREKFHPSLLFQVYNSQNDTLVNQKYDREKQTKRLERSQKELELLGKINPWAVEEYAQMEERAQFIRTQLDDLQQTRLKLLDLVKEMNKTIIDIFLNAFEDTAREFNILFDQLFPAGKSQLYLTDPDDPLNSGVEMSVTPAGKSIKQLSLLSGGERSLASLALVIAIFRARPSPFYVLDEVEAALDEANLQRLLVVFNQLKLNSQLIIVTHQKPTMVIADVLYGISMNESGVSKVVSTKLASLTDAK
ncbi:MAG: AAA family ATPase [Bifidobacteriaceae bacterium]|jgi:chromosome segregation ATPase|nr:AAA family ATPase [Bifidobacteriaceae bacterium]